MLNQTDIEKIKKEIQDFFKKATFEVEIEIDPQKEKTFPINIKTEDPQILIGEGGQTLTEIQHLLKAILRKKIISEEPFYLEIDINSYKKKKYEYLRELAKSVADEVALTQKEKQLAPMPAHERRIIHLELSGRTDVISESIGQEPERKIIIKPYL
jgi:spoIIIJ-associated protein